MQKKIKGMAAMLALAMIMAGCGAGGKDLAKKDYSASKYVTLGEYKGLEVEQVKEKKELSAEEKETALTETLESYAEQIDITDRGAQNGDCLAITYKCYQDQELVDETGEEEIEIELGTGSFFDEDGEAQLIGAKAGDTKTIEVTEADDEETYTYTYEVVVKRVYENHMPTLDDAIAAEEGYDSAEAMETAVYASALASTNRDYQMAAKDQLVQMVIAASETNGYPQDLYDRTYEQLNSAYQDFFGVSVDEIYAGDETSLKSAVEEMLVQELVIEALAEKEKITVSQKELDEYKQSVVSLYGYADISELEADFTDETMAESLLNEKVQDFLLAKAKVTYVDEAEYYGFYDEEEEGDLDEYAGEEEEIFDDIVEEDLPDDEL